MRAAVRMGKPIDVNGIYKHVRMVLESNGPRFAKVDEKMKQPRCRRVWEHVLKPRALR